MFLEPHESVPSPLAMIYRSEFDYISRCILDYPEIETGGQLFGYWTSTGIPVVLYAIGPGKNANHQETFFNQDLDYLVKVGNFLLTEFGLQHIGEWHSHHQLGLAHPSGHDASTMVNNIQRSHLRRFLLCIGNCGYAGKLRTTINAFNFHEDAGYDYVKSRWCVKEYESPFRCLVDSALRDVLIHPLTEQPCHGEEYCVLPAPTSRIISDYGEGYWLNKPENRKVLAEINQFVKNEVAPRKVTVMLDEAHHVRMAVTADAECNGASAHAVGETLAKEMVLYFPEGFPQKPVQITLDGNVFESETPWNFQGDILDAFKQYFMDSIALSGLQNDRNIGSTDEHMNEVEKC